MADTQRTESACLALMPLTGARRRISVQGMRDIVYTLFRGLDGGLAQYGCCHFTTPAATTLVIDTWTKASGTTTIGEASTHWTMPVSNRLLHTDPTHELYRVIATAAVTVAGANQTVWMGISKSGADPASNHQGYMRLANGADAQMIVVQDIISMSNGEYLELWVKNQTAGNAVTIQRGSLTTAKVV